MNNSKSETTRIAKILKRDLLDFLLKQEVGEGTSVSSIIEHSSGCPMDLDDTARLSSIFDVIVNSRRFVGSLVIEVSDNKVVRCLVDIRLIEFTSIYSAGYHVFAPFKLTFNCSVGDIQSSSMEALVSFIFDTGYFSSVTGAYVLHGALIAKYREEVFFRG